MSPILTRFGDVIVLWRSGVTISASLLSKWKKKSLKIGNVPVGFETDVKKGSGKTKPKFTRPARNTQRTDGTHEKEPSKKTQERSVGIDAKLLFNDNSLLSEHAVNESTLHTRAVISSRGIELGTAALLTSSANLCAAPAYDAVPYRAFYRVSLALLERKLKYMRKEIFTKKPAHKLRQCVPQWCQICRQWARKEV
ncbi:unnamed protein product [Trichogramma brassicae]|uniref:Uncharacterized protein n=1 Tax=Trichogramma brassicae TaxID=86971 RepID=A0A6H5J3L5_9HYME|nr:unnamed protein product [Trichogramma brassicae]